MGEAFELLDVLKTIESKIYSGVDLEKIAEHFELSYLWPDLFLENVPGTPRTSIVVSIDEYPTRGYDLMLWNNFAGMVWNRVDNKTFTQWKEEYTRRSPTDLQTTMQWFAVKLENDHMKDTLLFHLFEGYINDQSTLLNLNSELDNIVIEELSRYVGSIPGYVQAINYWQHLDDATVTCTVNSFSEQFPIIELYEHIDGVVMHFLDWLSKQEMTDISPVLALLKELPNELEYEPLHGFLEKYQTTYESHS